ncbi:hypothetical protein quinque_001168 [Culex quinquefasciatus]
MEVTAEETAVAVVATENGLESTATSGSKKKKAKKRNKSKNIGTNLSPEQQPNSAEIDVNRTSTSGKRLQNGLLEEDATTTHENSVDKVSEKLDQALQLNSNKTKNGLTNGTVSGCEEHHPEDGTTTSNGAVSKKRHRNKHKSKSQPPVADVAVSGNCQESLLPPVVAVQHCPAKPVAEPVPPVPEEPPKPAIDYREYESELQMPSIMALIQKDLSEPYSIYTYRYFIHNWPRLCFLALHEGRCVGAIVCKLDIHRQNIRRGYIAMLAVDKDYRKLKIGTTLVQKAIQAMLEDDADEVVLETEITNRPALRLYENLGFVRDKRLFHYYLNGVDALRLKLWFR